MPVPGATASKPPRPPLRALRDQLYGWLSNARGRLTTQLPWECRGVEVVPRQVYVEITKKDDDVAAWAKERRAKLVDPDPAVQAWRASCGRGCLRRTRAKSSRSVGDRRRGGAWADCRDLLGPGHSPRPYETVDAEYARHLPARERPLRKVARSPRRARRSVLEASPLATECALASGRVLRRPSDSQNH